MYLTKYVDIVLGLDQNNSVQGLRIIYNSCVWDVIPNPQIRNGLDFKTSQLDPIQGITLPKTASNWADLKSSLVLIVGFEISHEKISK